MHVMSRGAFHNALIIPVSFLGSCASTEGGGNAKRSRCDDLFNSENLARHLANYVMNQIPSLSIDHLVSEDFIDAGIWSEPFTVYACLFARASRILFLVTQKDVRAFEEFVSHRLQPLLERAKAVDSDWSSRFLVLAMGDFQLLTDLTCEVVRFREVGWFRDSMALFLLGKKIQEFWKPDATDMACSPDHLTVSTNLCESETFQTTLSVTNLLEDVKSLDYGATTPDSLEQESVRLIRRAITLKVDLKSSRELEVQEMLIQTPCNQRLEDIARPFLKPIRYYSAHSELDFTGTPSDMEDESAVSDFQCSATDSVAEMHWSPPDNVLAIGETDVISYSTLENLSPLLTANVRSEENLNQSASTTNVEGTQFSTNVPRIDIPSPFLEERTMERPLEAISERSCEEDSSIIYTESPTAEGDKKLESAVSEARTMTPDATSFSDIGFRPLRQNLSPHPNLCYHKKPPLQTQNLSESESVQNYGNENDHLKEKNSPNANALTRDYHSMPLLQQTPANLEGKSSISTHDEVKDTNISTSVSSKILSGTSLKPSHISKQVEQCSESVKDEKIPKEAAENPEEPGSRDRTLPSDYEMSQISEPGEEPKASGDLEASESGNGNERENKTEENDKHKRNELINQNFLNEHNISLASDPGVDQKSSNGELRTNSKVERMPHMNPSPNKQKMLLRSNSGGSCHSPDVFGSSNTPIPKDSEQASSVITDLDEEPNDVLSSGMSGGCIDVSGSLTSIIHTSDHSEMKNESGIEDYPTVIRTDSIKSVEVEGPEADQSTSTKSFNITNSGTIAEVRGDHCQNRNLEMLTTAKTEEVGNLSHSIAEKGKDKLITNNNYGTVSDDDSLSDSQTTLISLKREKLFQGAEEAGESSRKESSNESRVVDECQKESSGTAACTDSLIPSPCAHNLVDDTSLFEGNRSSKSEDRRQISEGIITDIHLKDASWKLVKKDQTGLHGTTDEIGKSNSFGSAESLLNDTLAQPGERQRNSFAGREEGTKDVTHSVEVKDENKAPFQKIGEEADVEFRGPATTTDASKLESETETSRIEDQQNSGENLAHSSKESQPSEVGEEEIADSITREQKMPRESLEQVLKKTISSGNVVKPPESESKNNDRSTPREIENEPKKDDKPSQRETLRNISKETNTAGFQNLLLKTSLDQKVSVNLYTKPLERLDSVPIKEVQESLSRRNESESHLHFETADMSGKSDTNQDGKTLDLQEYSDTSETQQISKILDERRPLEPNKKYVKFKITGDSAMKIASGSSKQCHLSEQSSRIHGEEGSCEIPALEAMQDIKGKPQEAGELRDGFAGHGFNGESPALPAQQQGQVNNNTPSEVENKLLREKEYLHGFGKEDSHKHNQSAIEPLNAGSSHNGSSSLKKNDSESYGDISKLKSLVIENPLGKINAKEDQHSEEESDASSSMKPRKGCSPKGCSPKRVTFLANSEAQNRLVEQTTSFAPRYLTSFRQQTRFSSGDEKFKSKVDPSIPLYPLASEVHSTVTVGEYTFQETTEILGSIEWQSAKRKRGVSMDLHSADYQMPKTVDVSQIDASYEEKKERAPTPEIREIRPPERPTLSRLKEEQEEMKEHEMREKVICNSKGESTVKRSSEILLKCPSPFSGSDCDPEVTSPTMARPWYLILDRKVEPGHTAPKIVPRKRLPSETEPASRERNIDLEREAESILSPHFYPPTAFESVEVDAPIRRRHMDNQPDSNNANRLSSISIEEEPSGGTIEVYDRASGSHSWINNVYTQTVQRNANSAVVQLLHETGEYQRNLSTQVHPPENKRKVGSHGPYYRQIKELSGNSDSSSTYRCDQSVGSPTPIRRSIGSDISTNSDASVDCRKLTDGASVDGSNNNTVEALRKVQKALQKASKIISSSNKIIENQVEHLQSERH